MSLESAKMPRLIDKVEAAAEKVQEKLEKKDAEKAKVIKKSAKKN